MNIKRKTLLLAMSAVIWFGAGLQGSFAASKVVAKSKGAVQSDTARTISGYFTPVTPLKSTPDAKGFIRRWSILEPINKPNRGNTVFTDSYLRKAFSTEYFPNQFTIIPKNGETVKAGEQELKWHARFIDVHRSFKNIHRSVNVIHRSFFVRQHRANDTHHKSSVINRFPISQHHSAYGEALRFNLLLQNNRNRPLQSLCLHCLSSLRRLLSGYKHPFSFFCK